MIASISSNVRDVGDAVSSFAAQVGQLDPKWLGVSLVLFQAYLLLRSRALFNALREAYPDDEFQWRRVWGAYVTGFGLNNVLPAGTGNLTTHRANRQDPAERRSAASRAPSERPLSRTTSTATTCYSTGMHVISRIDG